MEIVYSNYAFKQMFETEISTKEVEFDIENGLAINEYPDDKPYPSKLILAVPNGRPIHLVNSETNL